LRPRDLRRIPRLFALFIVILISSCAYTVKVDRSTPLQTSLEEFQPIALIPIPEAPGYPESGADVDSFVRLSLAGKGYRVIDSPAVLKILENIEFSLEKILSDRAALSRFQEESGAKLMIIGIFLTYRIRKPLIGEKTYQVWDGVTYEYHSLPTYYRGTFLARLKLRLMNPENGYVVWTAEGTAEGPSISARSLTEKLVSALLKELPPVRKPIAP